MLEWGGNETINVISSSDTFLCLQETVFVVMIIFVAGHQEWVLDYRTETNGIISRVL